MAALEVDPYAVRRSTGRCWLYSVISLGVWGFYWFHSTRKLLDGEIGDGRDDATLHTVGLLVPILNYFIVYWLWRDLDWLRQRNGQPSFSVVGYVIGAIFLSPLFYSLVNVKLNEYWDVRLQGYVRDAPLTTGDKVFIGVGAALFVLYILFIVITIIAAIASTGGS